MQYLSTMILTCFLTLFVPQRHAYNYTISQGGSHDPVAALIASHVNSTGVTHTTAYQNDIPKNGAELIIEPSPSGRAFLQKRSSTGGLWASAQGFPWVSPLFTSIVSPW